MFPFMKMKKPYLYFMFSEKYNNQLKYINSFIKQIPHIELIYYYIYFHLDFTNIHTSFWYI